MEADEETPWPKFSICKRFSAHCNEYTTHLNKRSGLRAADATISPDFPEIDWA